MNVPIAIVGMSCRFPGACDPGEFWRLITSGRVVTGTPGPRWRHDLFYDPDDPRRPEGTYTDRVAHLDDVKSFPALHFGLAPRRVEVTDPQHRLLIELTREALQDAGYERRPFAAEHTGVYFGLSVCEYKDLMVTRIRALQLGSGEFGRADGALGDLLVQATEAVAPIRAYTAAGTGLNMAAAAVSSVFDLRGPSFTIDAACSSSLVAVHEAVLHLRTRQCEVAIAGGAYLNFTPDHLVGFAKIGALSRSGVCRPFDETADGFVLGEGAGVVVLKRLDDALRDNDLIYAVLRGTACTNDGRAEGPMTPRPEGQLACLRAAYADAGLEPFDIDFIECHGTATTGGDAAELAALIELWKDAGSRRAPCYLSSVKANIGHTMAAAGIAALIKTALAIHHGTIPVQPGCDNRVAALRQHPHFTIADSIQPWQGRQRAALSAFGFGGTNVHQILERAPARTDRGNTSAAEPMVFKISAGSLDRLGQYAGRLAEALAHKGDADLPDVAYTLSNRAELEFQASFTAQTMTQLRSELGKLAAAPAVSVPLASAPTLGQPIHLPPSLIESTPHWVVESTAIAGETPLPVGDPVIQAIAHVSEFPAEAVRLDHTLVGQLGFDSIMSYELAEHLLNTWPQLPALPAAIVRPGTTVRDVITWVADQQQPAAPVSTQEMPLAQHIGELGIASPYFEVHEGVPGASTVVGGTKMSNFSSYDYLGLAGSAEVTAAAKEAIDRYGASTSASRAASGERPVHRQLEAAIARHIGVQDALVFVGGHATNVTVLGHIAGPGDLIVHDAFAHNSILLGAQLSGARRLSFPHNDIPTLDRRLEQLRPQFQRVFVVVEGVYSMDGDLADLPALIKLRERYNVELYVDEAHSIGVCGDHGRGIAEHWGVAPSDVDYWMGTLSKAFASCGGYIAGSASTITHLRHTTPGFLYSVGLPPSSAAAALASLGILENQPGLAAAARANASLFRRLAQQAGLNTGLSGDGCAIVPIVTGSSASALRLADRLRQRGVNVHPYVAPAVEEHQARLRFFLTAAHTREIIESAVSLLAAEAASLGRRS